MDTKSFDTGWHDAQATVVELVKVGDFDLTAYKEYSESLNERCRKFWQSREGVLVYRRMRVAEVFSYGCRDMRQSLEWQLGV